jgi:hypothetical protein
MEKRTLTDYVFDYYLNGSTVVIENGQVVGFETEE